MPKKDLDDIDGCEVNMANATTSKEQLLKLLGPFGGEPEPEETEEEHELRHGLGRPAA